MLCKLIRTLALTLQFPPGTSTPMEKNVEKIFPSPTSSVLEEHAEKKWRQVGHTQMPSPLAFVKWDRLHVTTPSTIIGVDGISTKSWDSVSFPFRVPRHCLIAFNTGTFFLKRFQTAVVMSKRHQAIADQLSKTFPAETIIKWEEMVKTWDK